MNIPKHPTLIKRMRDSRLRKLSKIKPMVAASLTQRGVRCGYAGCHCKDGEKHIGHYLTYKMKGKTKTVYVPVDMIEEVGEWIKEHRRIKQLSQEISQLSLALIKTHVKTRKKQKGK